MIHPLRGRCASWFDPTRDPKEQKCAIMLMRSCTGRCCLGYYYEWLVPSFLTTPRVSGRHTFDLNTRTLLGPPLAAATPFSSTYKLPIVRVSVLITERVKPSTCQDLFWDINPGVPCTEQVFRLYRTPVYCPVMMMGDSQRTHV